jgi:copper(I)-binding protein
MKLRLLVPMLALIATAALAQDNGPISASDVRARPTAPGLTTGVVYLTIINHGTADDTLTAVSTPVATKSEVHRTMNMDGMSKMDMAPSLPIKANGTVSLSPNGLHIMLMGLKQPLKLGDSFPLTLEFAKAGLVTVTVAVEPIKAPSKPMGDMPGMKM